MSSFLHSANILTLIVEHGRTVSDIMMKILSKHINCLKMRMEEVNVFITVDKLYRFYIMILDSSLLNSREFRLLCFKLR